MTITIGFIGLGHMGQPMARNLLKAGYQVIVYDVIPTATQALTQAGAKTSPDVVTLAQQSDVIITSVQTGEQVRTICLGAQGIFENAKKNLLFIDCSSIDLNTTHKLHRVAESLQIAMLDAPVSGGVAGAIAATLTIMVGGNKSDYHRAEPILKCLGKNIIHAGNAGTGQIAKICNNLLLGISMIGVSEAFALAEKLGLAPKKFFEISSQASGQCWSMTTYCPVPHILENVPSSHDYKPGFTANMMLKDLHLGLNEAIDANASIPLGALATELYEYYVQQGNGDKDFSGIIQMIADKE